MKRSASRFATRHNELAERLRLSAVIRQLEFAAAVRIRRDPVAAEQLLAISSGLRAFWKEDE